MHINRFHEAAKAKIAKAKIAKIAKDKNIEIEFDVDSLLDKEVDETEGFVSKAPFVSDLKKMPKAAEKKLKKEIQVTTPGLKKSIKKFEDFTISISVDEVAPEEDVLDPSKIVMGAINPNDGECCSGCDCSPCRCVEETTQTTDVSGVVPFMDFIKNV
jgi:hypothetical protein